MAAVPPIPPPDPTLPGSSPAALPSAGALSAGTPSPAVTVPTTVPSISVDPHRKPWWKTARKHFTNGRLSLAVGLLGLGLAIYAFIAPYALAKASLDVAEKANKITLWKDCRDRKDLHDTDLCQQYLTASLGSIIKRHVSEIWTSSAVTRIRSVQPHISPTLFVPTTSGSTFVWIWALVNVFAVFLRVTVPTSQPESCQLAKGYVTVPGALVWLAACLNALAVTGLAAVTPCPSQPLPNILMLYIKKLVVWWVLWRLLRRAYRYSGWSAFQLLDPYDDRLARKLAVQYFQPNFGILAGVFALAYGLFRQISALSRTAEWVELFDWQLWGWILLAKLARACFVGFTTLIAKLDKENYPTDEERGAMLEEDARRAREVLETEFDPFYEAVIGIRRVIAGEIWGPKASQLHPPAYLKKTQ